ncbi:flavin reductase family protein [Aestuariispira insulae]|nr:flavin reductase family protein [Aestuariispira insulae]
MGDSFTALDFRSACGQFATGVCVVTGMLDNKSPVGVTINSFSSVSLEPPLVLFCLDKNALSFDAFSIASRFAVNILAEDQQALSNNFARQSDDKFADIDYQVTEEGVPVLENCLTVMECRMYAVHDGGDHQIIVGEVSRIRKQREDARPLLYFRGGYNALASD